jgi:hypothetical protein
VASAFGHRRLPEIGFPDIIGSFEKFPVMAMSRGHLSSFYPLNTVVYAKFPVSGKTGNFCARNRSFLEQKCLEPGLQKNRGYVKRMS